ncbi:hypothetical protein APF79_04945 [bacterium BRH_c32]|nr:MAG: hypothetical protein APF79_04945 [bacterium BRH_c32]
MKILVIQTAFLGDAILTLPLIQKLHSKYPESKISVIAIPASKEIFNASEYVHNTIVYDKKGKDKSLKSFFRLLIKIRKEKFDKIYSPHRSFRSSLIVALSGTKETFGFNTSSMSVIYKNIVEYKKEIHEVARNLFLGGFDISGDNWKIFPDIKISPETNKKIENEIKRNFRNEFITIAIGSVWATKKYPIEYFSELAKYFISIGYEVALIGGKEDVNESETLSNSLGTNIVSFAGKLSLIESITLINRSKLLICNDSAPTHLGMATFKRPPLIPLTEPVITKHLGLATSTPVITLYCSTLKEFGFYPYADNNLILSYDNLDCKPCGIHGRTKCPLNHFNCGYKLTPQFVIDMINTNILNKKLN